MRLFLVFYILIICEVLLILEASNIAICISGHFGKWLPHYMFKGLISSNQNDQFYIFYTIEYSTSYQDYVSLFARRENMTNAISPLSHLKNHDLLKSLENLYKTSHSQIISIEFTKHKNSAELSKLLKITDENFIYKQENLINTYLHQSQCVNRLLHWEETSEMQIDYLITSKEDLYYLSTINLKEILPNQVSILNPSQIFRAPSNSNNHPSYSFCHVTTHGCGSEKRLEIYDKKSFILLKDRLTFYSRYFASSSMQNIEEIFGRAQINEFGYNYCHLSPENFPVISARYHPKFKTNKIAEHSGVCVSSHDTKENCFPQKFRSFLSNITCTNH